MTTNVFDGNAGMLATDSRWSIPWGSHRIIYVDDAQFDKIELYEDTAFVFAGKGDGVQVWKNWIRSRPTDLSLRPNVEGVSICMVDVPTGAIEEFSRGDNIVREGAYFAGSGKLHAYKCWDANRDAVKSVATAKQMDYCTGGETKFLELATRSHNLSYPTVNVTVEMVARAIDERGTVVDISVGNSGVVPFNLKDIAANDGELASLKAKIASGEISPEAPCDGMYTEWTDGQKSKLDNALSRVFKLKA